MTTALLAVAMLGTAIIIGLVAIAIGVIDHDREVDTGLDAADWDSHVTGALDLIRTEVSGPADEAEVTR